MVIEKNSHFQLTWVLPRFSVFGSHDHKALIPYGPYLTGPRGSYQWVRGTALSIAPRGEGETGGRVHLASRESIEYEYLVMATGSSARLPSRVKSTDNEDGVKALQGQRERFEESSDIVVVGGRRVLN